MIYALIFLASFGIACCAIWLIRAFQHESDVFLTKSKVSHKGRRL